MTRITFPAAQITIEKKKQERGGRLSSSSSGARRVRDQVFNRLAKGKEEKKNSQPVRHLVPEIETFLSDSYKRFRARWRGQGLERRIPIFCLYFLGFFFLYPLRASSSSRRARAVERKKRPPQNHPSFPFLLLLFRPRAREMEMETGAMS